MQAILVEGLAVNLATARLTMKSNSPEEQAMAKLGENVADAAKSIEEDVHLIAEPEKLPRCKRSTNPRPR